MYQKTTKHLTQNPHHTSKCGLLPNRVETIVQIMENIQFWSEKSLPHLTISFKSSVTLKLYGPDPLENCHLNVKKNVEKMTVFDIQMTIFRRVRYGPHVPNFTTAHQSPEENSEGVHATHKGCSRPSISFFLFAAPHR